ncbi:MAG: glycosyltransferase [Acidimicrobiaceae bacterium]|nr:glycosyltransferase [Acidimicrobiaceae bacterium]
MALSASSTPDETAGARPGPRFSIVVPVHRTPAELLEAAIASVTDQTLASWELLVVDDGPTASGVQAVVDSLDDPRIRVARPTPGDPLGGAGGEWITFLDQDDLLAPEALEICSDRLSGNPECDVLYTDEDWIDPDGEPLGRFLKPDWSPERLRCQHYVSHLSVFRSELIERVGGMRPGFDESQDHDLALRTTESARSIVHVPLVLYHRRMRPGQVGTIGGRAASEAARRAIEEHCNRIGVEATVEQIDRPGVYRLRRRLRAEPLVSLVIPTRGSTGLVNGSVRTFVTSAIRSVLERCTYPDLEFVVVPDAETPPAVIAELAELLGDRLTILPYEGPFNFSHKINLGVAAASGAYVVLLNDDIEVITPDWIETMLGIGQQPDVGMVGATLLFEDGTLQHAGHLYLSETAMGHVAYGEDSAAPGPGMGLLTERECSGVTAACALMARRTFFEVGGLSRQLPVNYNDVDLCLKVRSLGYRIVVTPHARLHHYESRTRRTGIGSSELALIRRRWGRILLEGDPYWRHP